MSKKLKRRPFGRTGHYVTEISLGAMNLRLLNSKEDGMELVDYALDAGINLIDTARGYNSTKPNGTLIESEVIIGETIRRRKCEEPIIIITKGHGYNPSAFDEELAVSLSKLGIIGKKSLKIGDNDIKLVYFFHGLSGERWQEMKDTGVLDYATKKQEEGYFDYLGFSSHNGHEAVIKEAIQTGLFQVVELPYSVFAPSFGKYSPDHGNLMELAVRYGMAVINMKAFGGNGMISKTKIFKDYCDISPQKRLLYCLSNPNITTVDAGCKYIEELKSDIETSFLKRFTVKECEELEQTAKKVTECINSVCRECTHCLEKFTCPQGLNFPEVLAVHTKWKLSVAFDHDIEKVIVEYRKLEQNAEICIQCGLCNEWCEYKLDIPTLLKEVHENLC